MRKEQISDALNLLDDAILEETDRLRNREGRKRAGSLWKWAAAAAGLLLAACVGWIVMEQKQNQSGQDSSLHASHDPEGRQEPGTQETGGAAGLPMLSVTEIGQEEAAGYEGVRVHDISELVNANPWGEALGISSLPVYENVLSYDERYIAQGGDFHKMREFLIEVAGSLGLEEESLTITDDVPDEETRRIITEKLEMVGDTVPEGYFNPTKLIGEAEGLKIEVNQAMTATVSFEPAVSLPEEYRFTHHAAYGELAETAEYLEKEYEDFIGMEHPAANIYGGSYNIDLQQSYWIEFYDRAEDMVQRIINYNFNRTAFYCDDQGRLYLARSFRPDLSRMVGEYPIITAEEAKEFLRKGNYITTAPYEMPGEEFIGKVELVYRAGERERYYMPYYLSLIHI